MVNHNCDWSNRLALLNQRPHSLRNGLRTCMDEMNWPIIIIMLCHINMATNDGLRPHRTIKKKTFLHFSFFITFSQHYNSRKVPTSFGSLTRMFSFGGGMKHCAGNINHKHTGVRSSSWISAKSEWVQEQETARCSFHKGRLCCSSAVKWGFT